jgi:fermentation-respiration switch protein FrsA (DUF1100 family)
MHRVWENCPMSPRSKSLLKRAGVFLLLCLVAGFMFKNFEHRQVYFPYRQLEASPDELGRPFENVRFKSPDGINLHAWYFPAEANSVRANTAILICHGNAGNISHRLDLCEALLAFGVNVFVFDYRGYGNSEGRPGEEGTYLDAQAAYAWLKNKGFEGKNIIAFGESLGGGVASELALRETLGGLILQSTFTSIPDVGAELFPWLPVRLISTIKYDTLNKLPRINVPVLVVHSRTDEIVRFRHAERLFQAANEPRQFCELSGGHNAPAWAQQNFRKGLEWLFQAMESE